MKTTVVGIIELSRQLSLVKEGERVDPADLVVGALSLNVSRLLALVADLLATSSLLGAITGVVTRLAAVVALHAVNTLAGHMAVAAAGVAGLASTATEAASAAAAAASTTAVGVAERGLAAEGRLGAVAGNVSHLTTLVALSSLAASAAAAAATGATSSNGAITRDMARLAALIAGLVVLHGLSAVTAHVTLATTVVALSRTLGRTVTSLMAGRTT